MQLSSRKSASNNESDALYLRGIRTLTRAVSSRGRSIRVLSRLAIALLTLSLAANCQAQLHPGTGSLDTDSFAGLSPELAAVSAAAQAQVIVLTAYSMDGTNSGTARLGHNVTVSASVAGQSTATFAWTLQGAGSLTSSGVYSAPAAMPSNTAVNVIATLTSNHSVTATYKMTLIYAVPAIKWVVPASLISGQTTAVNVGGSDFTAATSILVGGKVVSSIFQAPNVIAQIPVAAGSTASLSIVARNPSPGGGSSAAASAAVEAPVIVVVGYSMDGTNSGTARLGHNVTVSASVAGQPSATYTWTLQGAGTLSSAGVYSAPTSMPSNQTVSVTATLTSNHSVSAKYKMALIYAVPTISWVEPSALISGQTNAVSVGGSNFTSKTYIVVNGKGVYTVSQAPNGVIAQIPVAAGSVTALSLVARNPAPGGGSSAAVSAPVQPITIQLSSYSKTSLNPSTDLLGQPVQFVADVQGGSSAVNWAVNWSLQGGGTISSTGLYEPPSTMPTSSSVIVKASLTTNGAIASTYHMSLLDPVPVVNQSQPVLATAGVTNTIDFYGQGFEPGSTIQVNGTAVPTTYISSSSLSAKIAVSSGATAALSITAVNPAPGGGKSTAFSLMIAPSTTVKAAIGSTQGWRVAENFVGLSHEWGEAQTYMGTSQTGVNYIYRRLVQNIADPRTHFFVRIGGGSTDESVEPKSTTVTAFSDLVKSMPVHFSLGVNLGSDNVHLAEDQAKSFAAQMPTGSIAAIEIGNEPDNYATSGLRTSSYNFTDYLSDFAKWRSGILPLLPTGVKLLGPSLTTVWHMDEDLPAFEQQEASNVAVASAHLYAGYEENSTEEATVFPNDYLLKSSTSTQDISWLASIASTAHGYGQSFRVAEMNSIDDGGVIGISNTFSAALWSIDTMFEFANVGVDGVNWHGMSGCAYCAFTFGIQNVDGQNTFRLERVNPLYYGLLFFHDATANAARLLPVTLSSSSANVKVWATVDPSGTVRVAILNKDADFAGTVAVTLPGYEQATAIRLVAPSYQSTTGISFGGQTFDDSFDGNPVGSKATETFEPSNSVYNIPMQPMSAVLLTLTK